MTTRGRSPGTVTLACCGIARGGGCGTGGSVEYLIVREWQDRGVLHVHALVRIECAEAPAADVLRDAARAAVAASKVFGALVKWGAQAPCDAFRADGDGAKTIWYLSKALN